jgi:hypothetical protein
MATNPSLSLKDIKNEEVSSTVSRSGAGAVTLHAGIGVICITGLSTAAATSTSAITLTNNQIRASSNIQLTCVSAASNTGIPYAYLSAVPSAGSCSIIVRNVDGSNAFNASYNIYIHFRID